MIRNKKFWMPLFLEEQLRAGGKIICVKGCEMLSHKLKMPITWFKAACVWNGSCFDFASVWCAGFGIPKRDCRTPAGF